MGYDEGAVMIKIGREEPVASMDASGKIIYARHNDVQTVNIRQLGADAEEVHRCCDSEHSHLPHHLALVSPLRSHSLNLPAILSAASFVNRRLCTAPSSKFEGIPNVTSDNLADTNLTC